MTLLDSRNVVSATLTLRVVTKVATDSPYTVIPSDFTIICNAVGGAMIVNLPPATGSGRVLEVKKIDASINTVTLDGDGGDTIDGVGTKVISSQWNAFTIQDAASNVWYIL